MPKPGEPANAQQRAWGKAHPSDPAKAAAVPRRERAPLTDDERAELAELLRGQR